MTDIANLIAQARELAPSDSFPTVLLALADALEAAEAERDEAMRIGQTLHDREIDLRLALADAGAEQAVLGSDVRDAQHEVEVLEAENERLREALKQIKLIQPLTLKMLEKHGVVFDGPLGADPTNFQHVAFSIYSNLCEADLIALNALREEKE